MTPKPWVSVAAVSRVSDCSESCGLLMDTLTKRFATSAGQWTEVSQHLEMDEQFPPKQMNFQQCQQGSKNKLNMAKGQNNLGTQLFSFRRGKLVRFWLSHLKLQLENGLLYFCLARFIGSMGNSGWKGPRYMDNSKLLVAHLKGNHRFLAMI